MARTPARAHTMRFLCDENFNGDIVAGLLRRRLAIDLVRAQDVGLHGDADSAVLQWAAEHDRIVLTHDRKTFPDFAFERVRAGQKMPGVFIVGHRIPVRLAIEDILLIEDASNQIEWANAVVFLPL
jgi:predicted nuclease of predicted toxin-antitoxin system